MYKHFIKRMLDLLMAIAGVIVLAVPMLIIAIAVKVDSKGPIIFKQVRVGKNGKTFTIYKFRTMCDNAYEMGGIATRSDDPRITKVGAFLRRTSLDELPQMFNIIKGDMAIIGPRPILPVEFEEFNEFPEYNKRHNVLPGLFCTVDIEYRASATREQQFDMDLEYVDNVSFVSDICYFFKIIGVVLSGENVYREEIDNSEEISKKGE